MSSGPGAAAPRPLRAIPSFTWLKGGTRKQREGRNHRSSAYPLERPTTSLRAERSAELRSAQSPTREATPTSCRATPLLRRTLFESLDLVQKPIVRKGEEFMPSERFVTDETVDVRNREQVSLSRRVIVAPSADHEPEVDPRLLTRVGVAQDRRLDPDSPEQIREMLQVEEALVELGRVSG